MLARPRKPQHKSWYCTCPSCATAGRTSKRETSKTANTSGGTPRCRLQPQLGAAELSTINKPIKGITRRKKRTAYINKCLNFHYPMQYRSNIFVFVHSQWWKSYTKFSFSRRSDKIYWITCRKFVHNIKPMLQLHLSHSFVNLSNIKYECSVSRFQKHLFLKHFSWISPKSSTIYLQSLSIYK